MLAGDEISISLDAQKVDGPRIVSAKVLFSRNSNKPVKMEKEAR